MVSQRQKATTALDSITPPAVEPRLCTIVNEEDSNFESVTYIMKQIRLDSDQRSFFGRSSNLMLVKTALDLKQEYLGDSVPPELDIKRKRPEFWGVAPVPLLKMAMMHFLTFCFSVGASDFLLGGTIARLHISRC
jgi:hypothetical protein